MSDDSESIRVQLARMEGKQDVTNERLDTANRINDERHAAIKLQISTIDGRLNSHSERIGGMEKREAERGGERKGIVASGKLFMVLAGAIPVAVVAAILRAIGA
jgi:hypothetical protein